MIYAKEINSAFHPANQLLNMYKSFVRLLTGDISCTLCLMIQRKGDRWSWRNEGTFCPAICLWEASSGHSDLFFLLEDMGPTKQSSLASLVLQSYSPTYFESLWLNMGQQKFFINQSAANKSKKNPRGDSLWSQPALEPCMGSAHWRWRRKASRSQRPSSARRGRERWRTETRHSSWRIIPLNATGSLTCYKIG